MAHQLQPPKSGGLMRYGQWHVVALLNSPWEGSADHPWLRGARDANVLRHLRHRVFPEAAYSIWVDGKHQLASDPVMLLDTFLAQRGRSVLVLAHENQRCVYEEQRIIARLGWASEIPGYVDKINALTERYHSEGMPSEAEGQPQGAYDLAVIASRHDRGGPGDALGCLAYSEIESFTSRNQLHYPYVVWRSGAKGVMAELPHCAWRFWTHYVGHWSDHKGKFLSAL